MSLRDAAQEVRELGLSRTLYRVGWELRLRTGLARLGEAPPGDALPAPRGLDAFPFAPAPEVARALEDRVDLSAQQRLRAIAEDALRGRILCFGRWVGDYGDPIDWYRNPLSGARWPREAHWSEALKATGACGDIKLAWEAARFPQAFHLARAAAFFPDEGARYFDGFRAMVRAFLAASPFPRGIHWASSQECVIRLVAWLFASRTFASLGHADPSLDAAILGYARTVGHHLLREIGYAQRAVYNNHLITEALGLLLCGWLCEADPDASRWRALGEELLTREADAQVYEDGAYINQSHNYHRVIAQEYLFASRWYRTAFGRDEPRAWRAALARSLDFLYAHQNPTDGRLPNFGANDGSLPRVLSTCDFSDFRPLLQALSLHLRGERLYPAGPWDEEAAWSLGGEALGAPLAARDRPGASFAATGYHVLRGDDRASFACLRCGSVRDRFGQIDMLHVDLWWRGVNVLVDGGTYLYSGPEAWHAHFLGTSSHNTVTVDGRDQMLHYRRFKFLYWTKAALLVFREAPGRTLAVGEHRGYARHPGAVVHRRSVLRVGDDLWIIADALLGEGEHDARLHWLCGEFPVSLREGGAALDTPAGALSLAVFDGAGAAQSLDLAVGQEDPPRGWLSRYFAERVPVGSLALQRRARLPWIAVTAVGAGMPTARVNGEAWTINAGGVEARFTLRDGAIMLEEEP